MVFNYNRANKCSFQLFQFQTEFIPLSPILGTEFSCPERTFNFTRLDFAFDTSQNYFKNLKFFFVSTQEEVSNRLFLNQSLVSSFATQRYAYDFTNGSAQEPFWKEFPSAYALVVDQTKSAVSNQGKREYEWKSFPWKLENDQDLTISFWFIFDSSGFPQKIDPNVTLNVDILRITDSKDNDLLEIQGQCTEREGSKVIKCDSVVVPGEEYFDREDDFDLDKWILAKLTLSPVQGKDSKSLLARFSISQSNFTIIRDFQTETMLSGFTIDQISKIVFGGKNFKGAFKAFQLFNGAYYSFYLSQKSNCLIENSAAYYSRENPGGLINSDDTYEFKSNFQCLLCSQISLPSKYVYVPYFWTGSSCSTDCDETRNFLDFSTRFCRSCLDGKCFMSGDSSYNSYLYECGNGWTETYFDEQCDFGQGIRNSSLEGLKGCSSCKQVSGFICQKETSGVSACSACSIETCNSVVANSGHFKTDEVSDLVRQCKQNCNYIFWDDLNEEGLYLFIKRDGLSEEEADEMCEIGSESSVSHFPDFQQNECRTCNLNIINSLYLANPDQKRSICEDKCHYDWKGDREFCSEKFEGSSHYMNQAKALTILILLVLVVEYFFLMMVNKGNAFWLVWEFLVQMNMLLYVNYQASNNIVDYLLFLNFVTFQNLMKRFNLITWVQSLFKVVDSTSKANLYQFALSKIKAPERAEQVGRIAYFFGDAGIVICLLGILISLQPLMMILERVFRKKRKTNRFYNYIWWQASNFKFSIFFRFILETYVFLTFWAFIQIHSISIPSILLDLQETIMQETTQNLQNLNELRNYIWIIVSYASAIACLVIITGIFPALVFVIGKQIDHSKPREIQIFSSLFSGYSIKNWFGQNFSFIRLVRSFLIAFGVGFVTENPMIQCTFLIGAQVLLVGLVGTNFVMINKRLNNVFITIIIMTVIVYLLTTVQAICSFVGYPLSDQNMDFLSEIQILLVLIGIGSGAGVIGYDLYVSRDEIAGVLTLPEEVFWNDIFDDEEVGDQKTTKQGKKLKELLSVKHKGGQVELAKRK